MPNLEPLLKRLRSIAAQGDWKPLTQLTDEIAAALAARCFYVGALGSSKTHAKRLDRLRAKGFGETELARIHAPIGIDIEAQSPAEIAVAVLAEIIQARHSPAASNLESAA